MLKELKISNFRGFGKEVAVRFAPITVLIGRNNAGKSSIIKFLLMLQQSLVLGSAGFLVSRGNRVDLGKFGELQNVGTRRKYLHFSLEMEEMGSPKSLWLYLGRNGEVPAEKIRYKIESTVLYGDDPHPFQGKDQKIMLFAGEKEVLKRSQNIFPDSAFLNFSDEQQREIVEKAGDPETIMAVAAEDSCVEALAYQIRALRHILPVRKPALPRTIDTGKPVPPKDVGQNGRYAMHHLQTMKQQTENREEFIRRHLERVMGIGDIQFDGKGDLVECLATNQTTGATINISNFGFGVSQCIPIVVQGAIMAPYTTLMVEQPEVQVHPSAQLEMGQFFFDLWKDYQVGSVIETHSANILLRLRRLIKRGDLDAKAVSVSYFDFDDGVSTIKNIAIGDDGSFEPGIPMQFFGADIIEALEMGARK